MRSKIHWLSIVLAYSSLFLLGLADNLRGPLFPEVLVDLQLSDSKGSLLWATASFFGLIGSLFTNSFIQRRGVLASLRVSLAMLALGQVGMAISQNFYWALVSCLLFGLSLGVLGVSQNLLVLRAGPAAAMPKLQAGLHSNYALSSLLAPLFLTAIYLFVPGWRAGYLGGALLVFLGFVALCFVSREELDEVHAEPAGRSDSSFVGLSTGRTDQLQLRAKVFYVGVIAGLYVLTEIMISSRLALYLRREAGLDFVQTSFATTSFFVFLFAGRLLLVFWQPPIKIRTQMMTSLVLTLFCVLLALLVQPLALVLTGLTMAPFFPLAMTYLGEKFPRDLNLAMTWIMSMDGFLVVVMHILVGLFSDSLGITKALLIGPIALVISITLLCFDRRVFDGH